MVNDFGKINNVIKHLTKEFVKVVFKVFANVIKIFFVKFRCMKTINK